VNRETPKSSPFRFRLLLPVAQCGLAAVFGGIGLSQRSVILSRIFWEGETLWHSTARFHVWPWPFKFAVVSNFPAFLMGSLTLWPIGSVWPELPESVQIAPSLVFVLILWYWAGSRIDRGWLVTDKAPWIALAVFTLVCLIGAFLLIGYTGFQPYGFVVWVIAAVTLSRGTRTRSGIHARGLE
jgi:hypothetical protein